MHHSPGYANTASSAGVAVDFLPARLAAKTQEGSLVLAVILQRRGQCSASLTYKALKPPVHLQKALKAIFVTALHGARRVYTRHKSGRQRAGAGGWLPRTHVPSYGPQQGAAVDYGS